MRKIRLLAIVATLSLLFSVPNFIIYFTNKVVNGIIKLDTATT